MSAFLALTAAVKAALDAGAALHAGKGSVQRGRRTALPQADKWGVRINALRHAGERLDMHGQALQWVTLVQVGVHMRAASDEDAEAALDPLLVTVWGRLYDMTPPAGAQVVTLDPDIHIDVDEADQTVAVATLTLRISHFTSGAALAAAA